MSARFFTMLCLVGIFVCALTLVMFGFTPDVSFYGYHVESGNQCAIHMYLSGDVVLEDRHECGGFLVLTIL